MKDLEGVLKTLQWIYRERVCANHEMANSSNLGKKVSNIIPSSPIMGTTDISMMFEHMSSSLFNDMDILNANTIPFYDMYLDGGEKKGVSRTVITSSLHAILILDNRHLSSLARSARFDAVLSLLHMALDVLLSVN